MLQIKFSKESMTNQLTELFGTKITINVIFVISVTVLRLTGNVFER